jgi:hypothetical protein
MLTGDFNGNGRTDIAGYNGDARAWHVALSTGRSFDASAGFWIRGFGTPGKVLTGDFNGDGKTDIARLEGPFFEGGGLLNVALSTGSDFGNPGLAGSWFDWVSGTRAPLRPGEIFTGDFDGDRKTDIAWWDSFGRVWSVALSTGDHFGTRFSTSVPPVWITDFGGPGLMLIGDFNGDGKTDIAGHNGDANAWHVALSTGRSFDPSAGFWVRGFGGPGVMLTGDFNGDGKTDIAGYNGDANAWHVALSTGRSFDPSAGFWITDFGGPVAMLTGDFDGDRRTDIAAYSYNLAEQPILITKYNNPFYDTSNPNWASDICRNQQFFHNEYPPFEWMQVLDPASEDDSSVVGISGVAVMSKISDNDIPFTHPFGFDSEFFIAPDERYRWLLAPRNTGPDGEYVEATRRASSLGIWVPKGVLGVETDRDLIPPTYRVIEGDRVAVFGRWIVDAGHADFHTEIHPPLLVATARPGGRRG